MPVVLSGRCACGAIRYECGDAPIVELICHCRDCQRASGSSSAPIMFVAADRFEFISGEPAYHEVTGGSGRQIRRCFCRKCGSPLTAYWPENAALVLIQVGSLDDPSQFKPDQELWMCRADDWHSVLPETTKFEGAPSGIRERVVKYFAERSKV
jgi:hypothetical protein